MDHDRGVLTDHEALELLNRFDRGVAEKKSHFIGYPINAHIELDRFFEWWAKSASSHAPLNDVGNPYQDLPYMINTRPFERNVLQIFSDLLRFPAESSWGYITTGGTLSNEQGLLLGREFLKSKGNPILYFSEDSHYSILSTGRLLGIECKVIRSQIHGEMDYDDLKLQLDSSRPALFSLNIGTTFKGAIDKPEKVREILIEKGIVDFYIHADAALFGGFLPFLEDSSAPRIDFEHTSVASIAISGHKFFGSPVPMGIFLMKKEYLDRIESDFVEYIYTKNVTIPCSRSSLNALLFWWIIRTTSFADRKIEAEQILENARYLADRLNELGVKAWSGSYSNIVYFQAPDESISKKWSLAQIHCKELGHLAHVVVMQHVTKELIDLFLEDFHSKRMCA